MRAFISLAQVQLQYGFVYPIAGSGRVRRETPRSVPNHSNAMALRGFQSTLLDKKIDGRHGESYEQCSSGSRDRKLQVLSPSKQDCLVVVSNAYSMGKGYQVSRSYSINCSSLFL